MAKSKLKNKQTPTEFNFNTYDEQFSEGDAMFGMMTGILEGSRYQQEHALELTKLVLGTHKNSSMSEQEIYSIYQRALSVINEGSPLSQILEGMQ